MGVAHLLTSDESFCSAEVDHVGDLTAAIAIAQFCGGGSNGANSRDPVIPLRPLRRLCVSYYILHVFIVGRKNIYFCLMTWHPFYWFYFVKKCWIGHCNSVGRGICAMSVHLCGTVDTNTTILARDAFVRSCIVIIRCTLAPF